MDYICKYLSSTVATASGSLVNVASKQIEIRPKINFVTFAKISREAYTIAVASEFIKNILDELLELIQPFNTTDAPEMNLSFFTYILLGISRREFPILHSIRILSNDPLSGDAILDLSRRVFESMVSVEFMLIKTKEKQAAKFAKYSIVERWIDLEYLKNLGVQPDPAKERVVMQDFEAVKQEFLYKDGEVSHSWSKTTLEKMIEELVKGKVITENDKANLLHGYVLGNRKNHLASGDVSSFLDKSEREVNLKSSAELGTAIAVISYARILSVYAKEIDDTVLYVALGKLFHKLNKPASKEGSRFLH